MTWIGSCSGRAKTSLSPLWVTSPLAFNTFLRIVTITIYQRRFRTTKVEAGPIINSRHLVQQKSLKLHLFALDFCFDRESYRIALLHNKYSTSLTQLTTSIHFYFQSSNIQRLFIEARIPFPLRTVNISNSLHNRTQFLARKSAFKLCSIIYTRSWNQYFSQINYRTLAAISCKRLSIPVFRRLPQFVY